MNKIKIKIKKLSVIRILGFASCICAGIVAGFAIGGIGGIVFGGLLGGLFGSLLEKGILRSPV